MYEITAREAVTFGESTERQREAWMRRQWAHLQELREDNPLTGQDAAERFRVQLSEAQSTAYAYAMGWGDAMAKGAPDPYWWDRAAGLAMAFAAEWRHERWLFWTERTHYATGYANAWERVVELHGLDYRA